ncbi:hypothetical protein N7379_20060 [Rhizobium pusense]|uniref:hypothetical protein n=1 Tax=Agrobacterium pusense TaxID=648995 RepID=UPI00244CF24A|nr:hypothetical protein [Agrobacterium pusense]MDH0116789.1 hypothetical protein [Agrobacterium pusense]
MSTSETITSNIALCPCGKGHICRSVTTQDNPWSGIDISYGIDCGHCSKTWKASDGYLIHLEEERARSVAFDNVLRAQDAVIELMRPEIEDYFGNAKFRTMSSEHREMNRLSLSPRDIRLYRLGRNEGKDFTDLCYPHRNAIWLMRLAVASGKQEILSRLFENLEDCERIYSEKKVQLFPFDRSR